MVVVETMTVRISDKDGVATGTCEGGATTCVGQWDLAASVGEGGVATCTKGVLGVTVLSCACCTIRPCTKQ